MIEATAALSFVAGHLPHHAARPHPDHTATGLDWRAVTFTDVHRALGLTLGPLTDEMLDEAVARGVPETAALDWKSELPPAKGLGQTDFPKDVAAMANSGGGVIVYGVTESQKAATGRVDVGEFSEADERTFVGAGVAAIIPPVFGLVVHRLGAAGKRAVVVEVPASVDGPHLIFRGEYFGAPVRNGPDTVWMKERQIEVMYRARFDERRHAVEALDKLYAEASAGRDDDIQPWLVAVAHPRIPRTTGRLGRFEAEEVMAGAAKLALSWASSRGIHPIESVEQNRARPGLRRWVFANMAISDPASWKESWASIHHDGSVTLATKIGNHRFDRDRRVERRTLSAWGIECAIADLMALIRATAREASTTDYDIRVGVNWAGTDPMIINPENGKYALGGAIPIRRFTPVETTVNASDPDLDYHWHIHDLAEDCLSQGGIPNVTLIRPPKRPD